MINNSAAVKVKSVEILNVYLDVEPVPFNKGFYSVDMTFFFDVCLDVFCGPAACPVPVSGVSIFNKKVILYGSEGGVRVFTSERGQPVASSEELPIARDTKAIVEAL